MKKDRNKGKKERKEWRNYDRNYPYYRETAALKGPTQCQLVLLV
jgi:hypothetical protein